MQFVHEAFYVNDMFAALRWVLGDGWDFLDARTERNGLRYTSVHDYGQHSCFD